MEVISICLSDIPKELISTSDKNGKKYINLVVAGRKEPDKLGNTLTVFINQTKEEREAKKDKIYIGSGKVFNFGNNQSTQPNTQVTTPQTDETDDLPF